MTAAPLGKPRPNKSRLPLTLTTFGVASLLLAAGLLVYGLRNKKADPVAGKEPEKVERLEPKPKPIPLPEPMPEKPWYERGTLLEATIRQWRKADKEDKIRTCGAFAINFHKEFNRELDRENLRKLAEAIAHFVDTLTAGDDFPESELDNPVQIGVYRALALTKEK